MVVVARRSIREEWSGGRGCGGVTELPAMTFSKSKSPHTFKLQSASSFNPFDPLPFGACAPPSAFPAHKCPDDNDIAYNSNKLYWLRHDMARYFLNVSEYGITINGQTAKLRITIKTMANFSFFQFFLI